METFVMLLIPALVGCLLVRLLVLPVKLGLKIAIHAVCGLLCLWLLNTVCPVTGIAFPVNAVTVLTAGTLGLPGIGLMAWLAVMG